ncbi:predicted protein [Streptomyces viridochromogenes DSM 40736]|uniref:Predicted protein n=1 Tax=Streptomyces viridochromogenes (strain DSM 40736 / JCM 4977 / BCRC 1201 / Tue 494) TaxID=591159 RepID=D9XHJ4_STRVT|nr:predicted protein [Streptomyces viridochromogenes DSM 40736]
MAPPEAPPEAPLDVPLDVPLEATPDGTPGGAPEGAPDGTPDGAPLGIPEGAWQACRCCPDPPPLPEDDEESPEPQATNARADDSTSRVTAGTRRARFMRDNSKADEGVLRRALNQRRMGLPWARPVTALSARQSAPQDTRPTCGFTPALRPGAGTAP